MNICRSMVKRLAIQCGANRLFDKTNDEYSLMGIDNIEAFAHAIIAEYQRNAWISVDDRLPDDKQEVLIYAKGIAKERPHVFAICEYHKHANEFNQYDLEVDEYCQPTEGVTNWQPLSLLPIKEMK